MMEITFKALLPGGKNFFRRLTCCFGSNKSVNLLTLNPKIFFNITLLFLITPVSVCPAATSPTPLLADSAVNAFNQGASTISALAGIHSGFEAFGGVETHDIAMMSVGYGRIFTPVLGNDHFWRGNLEIRGELFGGVQYSPEADWIVGLTPHLRYNFLIGWRLIPFIDGGAGVTATGIGPPDLSGTFEFNLQIGAGLHWFFKDDLAFTAEARYMHLSCAGINDPNLGVNGIVGLLGLTWLF